MTKSNDDILNVTFSVAASKAASYWKENKQDNELTTQLVALASQLIRIVPAARVAGVKSEDVICGAILEFFKNRWWQEREKTMRALKAQQQVTVSALRAALDEVAKKNTITP